MAWIVFFWHECASRQAALTMKMSFIWLASLSLCQLEQTVGWLPERFPHAAKPCHSLAVRWRRRRWRTSMCAAASGWTCSAASCAWASRRGAGRRRPGPARCRATRRRSAYPHSPSFRVLRPRPTVTPPPWQPSLKLTYQSWLAFNLMTHQSRLLLHYGVYVHRAPWALQSLVE